MTRRPLPWYSGVRARVVLLAVIPLLAIAFVIGGYMVSVRLADARQALDERGEIIAANLAMAAELGVLTRDLDRLQGLCEAAQRQPDVAWAAVLGADGELLAQSGDASDPEHAQGVHRAAIGTAGVQVEDFADAAGAEAPRPLGWAEVSLSLEGTKARQRVIQLNSLLIIGVALAISLLVARRIGAGISRPLLELSEAMSRYREGERGVRIATKAEDEIAELARDFNRMAQALERSQSELREQVVAATAELQRTVEALSAKNAQLETARAEAVKAGEEKYEFLARMSHEIRTPLNAVIGFSRLLHRGDAGARGVQEYTRTIDRAANQLLTVIDDILSFTRLEVGTLELEHLPFDPRACLEDVVAMLSPAAHEKGLELALVLHHDIPETLTGDPDRIVQVLVNLLENAIKFTEAGHVFVEAGYARDEQGQGTVRISVTDTGMGLSTEQRERIFQPFVQADSSVTRRYGGTGLGLVISRRLVELMGGTITVDSKPGKGSRFCFTILCGEAPRPVSAPPPSPLAGLKVLVYDREPAQLRALRAALLGWSIRVFNTARRERVPKMLENATERGEGFDLLILGLSAPEGRPEACDALMAEIRPHFAGPMLVLVGAEHWQLPSSVRGSEALDWATKPLRRSLLHRCLCRLAHRTPGPLDRPQESDLERPDFPGRRALVVEDNAFNRELMRRLLELRGIQAQEVLDGPEAIAAAARERFDLILMDIHMPGMDGIETARRIRALAGDASCPPIVALSADVFARDRTIARGRVFDGFLLKPVSQPALDEMIRRFLASDGHSTPTPLGPEGTPATGMPGLGELPADLNDLLHRESETLCDRLEAAIAVEDREAVRELAHTLKGLFGYFGRRELETAVRALETAALDERPQRLRERVKGLRKQLSNPAPRTDT